MIIGELRRHLRDYNTIRVPRSLRDIAYKALKAKEHLSLKMTTEPTVEDISKEINENVKSVTMALDAIMDPISLYDPIFNDNGDALFILDQIKDEKETDENWTDNIAIRSAIALLGEREKQILLMRFYEGKTQTEISKEIGISQAQVSRLEKSSLEKMRKQMN
jgi:RNA polymerase sporulation-specific sigma factor